MTKLQQWFIDTANHTYTGWYYTEGHRPVISCEKWPPMIFEVGVSFPCTPQRACNKNYPCEYTHICIESPLPIPSLLEYLMPDTPYCGYHPIYSYRYGFVPIEVAEKLLREKRGKLSYDGSTNAEGYSQSVS